jgi:hypothetical protein
MEAHSDLRVVFVGESDAAPQMQPGDRWNDLAHHCWWEMRPDRTLAEIPSPTEVAVAEAHGWHK